MGAFATLKLWARQVGSVTPVHSWFVLAPTVPEKLSALPGPLSVGDGAAAVLGSSTLAATSSAITSARTAIEAASRRTTYITNLRERGSGSASPGRHTRARIDKECSP